MQKWEYFWFRVDDKDFVLMKFEDRKKKHFGDYLDSVGIVGWELVSVIEGGSRQKTFYFKRPIEE